jgi:hypothetical protein
LVYKRIILALFWILLLGGSRILSELGSIGWATSADTAICRPTGDREGTTWTIYPSGSAWDAINDTIANDEENFIHTSGTGTGYRNGWYHSDFTVSDNIDSVKLTMRARSPNGSGTREIIFGRMDTSGGAWIP